MNTTSTGRAFEDHAADYLSQNGYKIVARNWRARACEIDIVASRDRTIFIVEVRYRRGDGQGGPLETINSSKLSQMRRSAEVWSLAHDYDGEIRLMVMAYDNELKVILDPEL